MPGQTIAFLTKDCNAKEFAEQVSLKVFGQLGEHPTHAEFATAFSVLQELYRRYDGANRCQAQGFPKAHPTCTKQVWEASYDRLHYLENLLAPAAPQRLSRKRKASTSTQPAIDPAKEQEIVLGELDATLLAEERPG